MDLNRNHEDEKYNSVSKTSTIEIQHQIWGNIKKNQEIWRLGKKIMHSEVQSKENEQSLRKFMGYDHEG